MFLTTPTIRRASALVSSAARASSAGRRSRPTAHARARSRGESEPPSGSDTLAPGQEDLPFSSEYHTPVMVREVCDALVWDPGGTYVDGTLGGGGHSAAILERINEAGGKLLAVDRDPQALATARGRLAAAVERGGFATAESDFRHLKAVLGPGGALAADVPEGGAHGLLLDLGVSSHQLDEADRGFSFRMEGPLDMRMDRPEGAAGGEGRDEGRSEGCALTASVIVNEWPFEELRRVLSDYGEEPRAHKMSLRISEARPVESTAQLVDIVRSCLPPGPPKEKSKALSRVFQGLRIAVNDELGALEAILRDAPAFLRPGGRIVVLSYHSLEDRRVKRVLRSGSLDGVVKQDERGNTLGPWQPLRKVPKQPSPAEVAANPRSRSARLRAAERTSLPPA